MCRENQCQPGQGWIQLLLLRILYEQPTYGYHMMNVLESFTQGQYRPKPGAIYTILRRMEDNALLISKWVPQNNGPDRRVYSLTEEGKHVLKNKLKAILQRRRAIEDLIGFYMQHFEKGDE